MLDSQNCSFPLSYTKGKEIVETAFIKAPADLHGGKEISGKTSFSSLLVPKGDVSFFVLLKDETFLFPRAARMCPSKPVCIASGAATVFHLVTTAAILKI